MLEKNSKAFLVARKSFLERHMVSVGDANMDYRLKEELDGISNILAGVQSSGSMLRPNKDSYAYGKV